MNLQRGQLKAQWHHACVKVSRAVFVCCRLQEERQRPRTTGRASQKRRLAIKLSRAQSPASITTGRNPLGMEKLTRENWLGQPFLVL
jgi:hypothetical protein